MIKKQNFKHPPYNSDKADRTNKQLQLAFAGTSRLAVTILESLLQRSEHHISIVLTRPDKPAGRGRKLTAGAVKTLALAKSLRLLQPTVDELPGIKNLLKEVDLMVVVSYGLLLPEIILNAPAYGCINIHTSLLPKWRGAAPIQRAIQAGDSETGITIIQMDDGLDTGPMLLQKKCRIDNTDTALILENRLAGIAEECLIEVLDKITSGSLRASRQDPLKSSYAEKISQTDAEIDWTRSAREIDRAIRAFNPAPGCHTSLANTPMKIWQADVIDDNSTGKAGRIISCTRAGIDVAAGRGIIRILRLQLPGKRDMSVADFLNGNPAFGARH